MKKVLLGLALFGCCAQLNALGAQYSDLLNAEPQKATKTVYGPANYTNVSFEGLLKVMGPLTADNLSADVLEIYGPAEIKNSKNIGSATIMGPLTAINSTFSGDTIVNGNITTEKTTFKELLSTNGTDVQVVLEDTQAQDITIRVLGTNVKKTKDGIIATYLFSTKDEPEGTQVILKGNTVVEGTIKFVDGKGRVVVEDTARHTGTVIGAEEDERE